MRIVRMPSQKSTQAIAPKRQRGRDRVAAILEAATQLFIDQGAAVTMTEIAARSGTAIGSLYRFFPTRDALVATLLERYTEDLHRALTAQGVGVDVVHPLPARAQGRVLAGPARLELPAPLRP